MNNVERLLYLRGVAAEYLDYYGEYKTIPLEVRVKMLEAVGYDLSDSDSIDAANFELDAEPWKSWLKGLNIVPSKQLLLTLRVSPEELAARFKWQITTELGEQYTGEFIPSDLAEAGEYYLDGQRYTARHFNLPLLPLGYHWIELSSGQGQLSAIVAVTPQKCFEVSELDEHPLWGLSCQLYTLRSKRNWGIGDFTDLDELVGYCADAGMDFLTLNPLHAPHLAGADFASPYSPSDRRFLNPLYLDIERIDDFVESNRIRSHCASEDHQQKIAALRELPLVDYDTVAALKYPLLAQLFEHFLSQHIAKKSPRAEAFESFVEERAAALQAFSQHESEFGGLTLAVASDPRFHQYLQWQTALQREACQARALKRGMSIGLMGDLAVGAAPGGAEVEGKQGLYCPNATVGAPPDPLADQGQDWALPALDPIALQRDNYQHFIELLQSNMAGCGALRIDHVMSLLRLWWCLPDNGGGAYLYYPLEDLLALLCLESQRNQCVVVGEDLGVVPEEMRERMADTSVLGNKVFYFERDYHQQFQQPEHHRRDALLMVANHDVPPLAGWWHCTDLHLRAKIGLLNSENDLPAALSERATDKARLLSWLESQALLPTQWMGDVLSAEHEKAFDLSLCGAIFQASARSRSQLMSLQLDDLQLLKDPVNIPGTYREYPNWRRKQPMDTASLFADGEIQALLKATYQQRKPLTRTKT